jgi:hypothetical protein
MGRMTVKQLKNPFQQVSAHTKKQPWEGGSAIGDGRKWSSVMTEDWR